MRPQIIKSKGAKHFSHTEPLEYNPKVGEYGYYNDFRNFKAVISYLWYKDNKDKFIVVK